METLGKYDKQREEELIKTIETFKEYFTRDNHIKIIVSDLSKRLFYKLCNDGILKEELAFTDLSLAKEEYMRRKQTEEYPKIDFILSPNLADCFGDEEFYYINKFMESIIKNSKKILWGDPPYEEDTENFKMITSILILNIHEYSYRVDPLCMPSRLQNRFDDARLNPETIDIIRYILGIYEIHENKIEITKTPLFPKLNDYELIANIFKEHYKTMIKNGRYMTSEEDEGLIRVKCYDLIRYWDLFVKLFERTIMPLDNLTNDQKEEIEELHKWGLLTKDTEGNYHYNYETYSLIAYIFNNYSLVAKSINQAFSFAWREDEKSFRKILSEQRFKSFENIDEEEVKKLRYCFSTYAEVITNHGGMRIWPSHSSINKHFRDLELFKNLEEKKELNKKLVKEKR